MSSEIPSFESNQEGSGYIYYEKALAKAEKYIEEQTWKYKVQIVREVVVVGEESDKPDCLYLKFIDESGSSWNMSVEESDEYIDRQFLVDLEKKYRTYPNADQHTTEIYTGNRALERVKEILDENKKGVVSFEDRMKISQNTSAETIRAMDSMMADLSEEEQKAFKLAIANGLEDYYFSNYMALRRRLDSNPFD